MEIYTCPMHPKVEKSEPGKCPGCGMDLILKKTDSHSDHEVAMPARRSFGDGGTNPATAKQMEADMRRRFFI